MQLTTAQIAALKAAYLAETAPAVVAARQAGNAQALADYYNQPSTFIVWRTSVSIAEMQAVYVWSEIVALSAGQFNALSLMQAQGALNPAVANVRSGMGTILAAAPNTLAALTALAKRPATLGEKVLASGTGTNASPGTLGVEGAFTEREFTLAING